MESVQIGGLVFSAKKVCHLCKQRPSSRHRLPEDDASGDYQLNLGPRVGGTPERELAPDASGALPHPLQSEVSVLPPIRDSRVNPYAIVTHAQGKVVRISALLPIDLPPNAYLRCGWLRNQCD